MKSQIKYSALLTAITLALTVAVTAHAETARYKELASLPFPENLPTKESADTLRDELLFQRATQVYLWALPAMNMWAMKEGSEKQFGAGYNVLPVWQKRLDAKTLVTTPNSDVIYAMSYLDVAKDGPLVVDVPPKLQGIFDDFWQRPICDDNKEWCADVGFLGPDKGHGGKYLILPADYKGQIPQGYHVYRSRTNNVFLFWRAFFADPAKLDDPVKLIKRTRVYPLGKEASAKPMQFPDASGVPANLLFAEDGAYFDALSRFVNSETVDPADLDWRGMMASLGIVKGQPFKPDAHTREILDAAAKTAYKMSKVVVFNEFGKNADAHIYPDRQWLDMSRNRNLTLEWAWKDGSYRDLNSRINFFTSAYSYSPAMLSVTPGKGARYLLGMSDAQGELLHGGTTYRLHLPANVPTANFWSLTLYDAKNASGLDNGQPFPSLGSRDKPVPNADGSTDIYIGPTAPSGKERNWLKSVAGKGYFTILRIYSPTENYFNKSWKPGDLEVVK